MPLELGLDETRAWLALLRAPGLGASGIRELVGRHGSACAAQESEARVSAEARAWLGAPDAATIERDLAWLAAPDHHLIVASSEDFPALLRDAANPPAALFVAGDAACLWSAQIAIVGSRSASAGGLANARAFAKTFAQAGNTVTSGLAEGVDGAAHEGAHVRAVGHEGAHEVLAQPPGRAGDDDGRGGRGVIQGGGGGVRHGAPV